LVSIRRLILFLILCLSVILLLSCRATRYSGPQKQLALTFDDGPDSVYTAKVLRVLKRHQVHATFFLIGTAVEKYPLIVKKIDDGGHLLGNHSYHHLNFWNLSCDQLLQNEILRTEDLIFNLTGKRPRFYRPPFGYILDSCESTLRSGNYIISRWDVDPRDWDVKRSSVKSIENYIKEHSGDNCVVLLHCGNGDRSMTVSVLSRIIRYYKGENYKFVRLDELMNTNGYLP
jgi:peptidoglycan-N-acetylglucosamine deacetylase